MACIEPVEYDYLGVNLTKIDLAFSLTKYGFAFKGDLGNLRLLDKKHRTLDNQYTEFLSSSSSSTENLIKLRFRKVEPEAPNFASLYQNTLSKIWFKCTRIQVVCHRTAIMYFINFGIQLTSHRSLKIAADSNVEPSVEPSAAQTDVAVVRRTYGANESINELSIQADMDKLTWKMYDNEMVFGNMQIRGNSLC